MLKDLSAVDSVNCSEHRGTKGQERPKIAARLQLDFIRIRPSRKKGSGSNHQEKKPDLLAILVNANPTWTNPPVLIGLMYTTMVTQEPCFGQYDITFK